MHSAFLIIVDKGDWIKHVTKDQAKEQLGENDASGRRNT